MDKKQSHEKVKNSKKPFFKFQDDQVKHKKLLTFNKKEKHEYIIEFIKLVVSMIIQLVLTVLLVFPYIVIVALFNIVVYFFSFWKKDVTFLKNFVNPFMQIIIILSSLFLFAKCAIEYYRFDDVQHLWFLNAFYLFTTQMLISTYIKSIKYKSKLSSIFTWRNFFSDDNLAINVYNVEHKSSKYIFDIRTKNKQWKEEYESILNRLEVDLYAQVYNPFFSKDNNPITYDQRGFNLIKYNNDELMAGKWQYPALSLVAFIKLVLTTLYFYQQHKFNDPMNVLSLIVLSLFYINVTWILSKLLASYDLRRKVAMLGNLNDQLLLSGAEIDYHQKLDTLSVRSLETWDNVRRATLMYFREEGKQLEACYVCLFFYYIFVALICFTAYGEIYIFISKDSIYLHPIMIISNTMDFIFLNIILFTRIYNGQKFNNTFEETEERLDALIGVTEDLLQIYDYYFNKKCGDQMIDEKFYIQLINGPESHKLNISHLPPSQASKPPNSPNTLKPSLVSQDQVINLNLSESDHNTDFLQIIAPKIKQQTSEVQYASQLSGRKENESVDSFDDPVAYYTIYDIVVSKIKFMAHYYIENRIEFQGQLYEYNFQKQLHIQLLQSSFTSLNRIKKQVEVDSKIFSYKFLGILKVVYQETLITILIAILTIMPQVLPKLIDIFKKHE